MADKPVVGRITGLDVGRGKDWSVVTQVHQVESCSACDGRVAQLNRLSEERRTEWTRAELAEADLATAKRTIKSLELAVKLAEATEEGIRRFIAGEPLRVSTGIDGTTTYGYGDLDNNGYWQYPVPDRIREGARHYNARMQSYARRVQAQKREIRRINAGLRRQFELIRELQRTNSLAWERYALARVRTSPMTRVERWRASFDRWRYRSIGRLMGRHYGQLTRDATDRAYQRGLRDGAQDKQR